MEPYLSLEGPEGGAKPDGTEGCPSDRPEGAYLDLVDDGPRASEGVDAGCSNMLRADIRDDVGVSRIGTDFLGVRSSSVGLSNILPKGEPLTGVDWGVEMMVLALVLGFTVKTASATSAAGVDTALIVSIVLTVSID
jgi:hypothetical protein